MTTSGIHTLYGTVGTYQVYCDMTTLGGGWTLVVKVKGTDPTMSAVNTDQWRDGKAIGSVTDLKDENALGSSYSNTRFTDVMIRSLTDASKHVAWRHPNAYTSMKKVVNDCKVISDGQLLSGSLQALDYAGASSQHNQCSGMKYGFFGYDYTYDNYSALPHAQTPSPADACSPRPESCAVSSSIPCLCGARRRRWVQRAVHGPRRGCHLRFQVRYNQLGAERLSECHHRFFGGQFLLHARQR